MVFFRTVENISILSLYLNKKNSMLNLSHFMNTFIVLLNCSTSISIKNLVLKYQDTQGHH